MSGRIPSFSQSTRSALFRVVIMIWSVHVFVYIYINLNFQTTKDLMSNNIF